MRISILFGSVLSVFLMLMVQINPTVGYYVVENEKDNTNKIFKNRKDIENNISDRINEIKNKYPALYNKMNNVFSKYSFEILCDFLFFILAILNGLYWTVVVLPVILVLYIIYIGIGCYTGPPP